MFLLFLLLPYNFLLGERYFGRKICCNNKTIHGAEFFVDDTKKFSFIDLPQSNQSVLVSFYNIFRKFHDGTNFIIEASKIIVWFSTM